MNYFNFTHGQGYITRGDCKIKIIFFCIEKGLGRQVESTEAKNHDRENVRGTH